MENIDMSVMVIDTGNSIIKAKIARRERSEIAFPHALWQLSESEYEKILARVKINGNTQNYFRVNSTPYVVGESAERHGLVTQRTGTVLDTLKIFLACWQPFHYPSCMVVAGK